MPPPLVLSLSHFLFPFSFLPTNFFNISRKKQLHQVGDREKENKAKVNLPKKDNDNHKGHISTTAEWSITHITIHIGM